MKHIQTFLFAVLFGCLGQSSFAQLKPIWQLKIDSLIKSEGKSPTGFNGVVLVAHKDAILYANTNGMASVKQQTKFTKTTQFVIGSLSKQITAVLILQEVDKHRLKLDAPIKTYLPELTQPWASVVTTHQLLNHTSGIVALDTALATPAGTTFAYSGLGYALLGRIIASVSGKSYASQVTALFKRCGMLHSTDPSLKNMPDLAEAYIREKDGTIREEIKTFETAYIPAGSLISCIGDLQQWNKLLHGGKLLSKVSYQKMTTASSKRNHPIWGNVGYGYGIQLDKNDGLLEFGHSGYSSGFVSINFYYPASQTSVIVLENFDRLDDDFKKTFSYEEFIRDVYRKSLLRR